MRMLDSKGKGKAVDPPEMASILHYESDRGASSLVSSDEYDASSHESDTDPITPEYLDFLIAKAKARVVKKKDKTRSKAPGEEEEIRLEEPQGQKALPPLEPGPSLPKPYLTLSTSRTGTSSLACDVEADRLLQAAPSEPSAPPPPPELNKDGTLLTKRQKKEQKETTTGPDWFDLPAPGAADLPKLYREVEALRLRNSLDPKRFYRKEAGEGKGIKGLPKHFAIGTILPSSTPFGTPSGDNLPRAQRKRTVVDELVDDAEAKRYAKRKFLDLQGVRGERGRGTFARKKAGRRGKW